MNNAEIAQKFEPKRAPKAAVAALIGSLLIPAACGGNTTEPSTTTPPTTIETTTTLPPTTTTIPETTTTTTVPETTTTTLPADICEPTGQARIGDEIIKLGLIKNEIFNFPFFLTGLTGRVVSVYEKEYVDFQGENVIALYADICVGSYSDESPILVPVIFGRTAIDLKTTRWYSNADLNTSDSRGDSYNTLINLKSELEERVKNYSQIGLVLTNTLLEDLPSDFNKEAWTQDCIRDLETTNYGDGKISFVDECNYILEEYELIPNNTNLIEILSQDSIEPLVNISPVIASEIYFFKPTIPNS